MVKRSIIFDKIHWYDSVLKRILERLGQEKRNPIFCKEHECIYDGVSDVIISLHPVSTFSSKVVTEYLMKEYPPAYQVRYP